MPQWVSRQGTEDSAAHLLRRFSIRSIRSQQHTHDRPFLKICEKCRGKGQISYFNNNQDKTYGPCDQCCKGEENSQFSLGVKLKCTCQKESSNYSWLHARQARAASARAPEIKALLALQEDLLHVGSALLLNCPCGAAYLCIDGPERRKISTDLAYLDADKKYNREVADTLIKNGIHRVLQPGPELQFN